MMYKKIELSHKMKLYVADLVTKHRFVMGEAVFIKNRDTGKILYASGFLGSFNPRVHIGFVSRRGRKYIRTELRDIITAMEM